MDDRVLQYFRDGVPGVSYFLRCRVETTIGRVVVSEIRIRIYRARGAGFAAEGSVPSAAFSFRGPERKRPARGGPWMVGQVVPVTRTRRPGEWIATAPHTPCTP